MASFRLLGIIRHLVVTSIKGVGVSYIAFLKQWETHMSSYIFSERCLLRNRDSPFLHHKTCLCIQHSHIHKAEEPSAPFCDEVISGGAHLTSTVLSLSGILFLIHTWAWQLVASLVTGRWVLTSLGLTLGDQKHSYRQAQALWCSVYHKVTHRIGKAMSYLSIESVKVPIVTKSHSKAGMSEGSRMRVHGTLNNKAFSDGRSF